MRKSYQTFDPSSNNDAGSLGEPPENGAPWPEVEYAPILPAVEIPYGKPKNSFPSPIENKSDGNEFWEPVALDSLTQDGGMIDWLWQGYIGRGLITLLVGLWKGGKTTLTAHLLKALKEDGHFLRMATKAAKVLIVTEESGIIWIERRDKFQLGGAAVDIISRPFKGRATWPDWKAFQNHVTALVRERGYDLVIIDVLAHLWPVVEENKAGEVLTAALPFQAMAEMGAAILLVQHPRKGDADEGQASRGSGALPGLVDIIAELRRFNPKDRECRRRVLTAYSRLDETPSEMVIEFTDEGYQLIGTKSEAHNEDRKAILQTVVPEAGQGLTYEEIRNLWPGKPKPSTTALKIDLAALETANKVARLGSGKRGDPFRFLRKNSFPSDSFSIGDGNEFSSETEHKPSLESPNGGWRDL